MADYTTGHIRVLNVSSFASSFCMSKWPYGKILSPLISGIENFHLDLALNILAAAAKRLELLRNSDPPASRDHLQTCVASYYMLRIQLVKMVSDSFFNLGSFVVQACFQARPDIAEHLFSHMPSTDSITNPEFVISGYYDIGCDALAACQYDHAVKWLERAVNEIHNCAVDQPNRKPISNDMRLLVRHTLSRYLLSPREPDLTCSHF